MKRGYMDWAVDLLPKERLMARREALVELAREQNLEGVIVYGDVYAADELSWYCNYAPYWSNAVLVVTRSGDVTLVTGHNNRVNPWISSLTGLPEKRILPAGPRIAEKLGTLLRDYYPKGGKVGSIGTYMIAPVKRALSEKNFTLVSVDEAAAKERERFDSSFYEMTKKAYIILKEAILTGISSCDLRIVSQKEVCAEVEYAARKNSAMDVSIYTSDEGNAFHLPDNQSKANGTWNLYVMMQYLGIWVSYGLTIGISGVDQWERLDQICSKLRPSSVPVLTKAGMEVSIRPRGGADMIASLDRDDVLLQEGGIVAVGMLEKERGFYFERMYEITASGGKAL
jgi:hypothetical protein